MTSTAPDSAAFTVERLDVFVFRAPADPPVQTSFGVMRDRPAVLVRLTDADGAVGWGEIWCNFPTVGAEHRARMALAYCRPAVTGRAWSHPRECFDELTKRFAVLALQTGEHGTLNQIVAGVDTALWDLYARRQGKPLWQVLGGEEARPVQVYASGLNPTEPEKLALQKRDEGYRAFKLKVGFGAERDLANLRALRDALGSEATMMVDANQAWDFDEACKAGHRMEDFDLLWLEEPLRADQPAQRWKELSERQPLTSPAARTWPASRSTATSSRPRAWPSSSPTWASGAASAAASMWRSRRWQRASGIARTGWAAASASSPRCTSRPPWAALATWRSTAIRTRCANCWPCPTSRSTTAGCSCRTRRAWA